MSKFPNVIPAIKFGSGSYPTQIDGQIISFREVELFAATITLSQAKQIVQTQIQGRDGTVKEYVGLDDYDIKIEGTITGANGIAPTDDVLNLKRMLDAPITLDIICPFLNQKGIHNAVITGYSLPQMAGGVSYQTYSIDLISDYPYQLRIASV